jgi:hypothetical protein
MLLKTPIVVKLKCHWQDQWWHKILKLPNERIIVVTKEGYSLKLAKYFKGEEGEHYVLKSDYLIAKTYINQRVFRLKAHIEICTFR